MARNLTCSHCGGYVGNCGHVVGGSTAPVTLSGTCPSCQLTYSATCSGNCITPGNMTATQECGVY